MDVTNGEVLAMASAPTFSPSVFVGGVSSDDWNQLSSESAHNPLLNRAAFFDQPVGQGRLAMVDMGNDGKVANFTLFGHIVSAPVLSQNIIPHGAGPCKQKQY